MHVAINCSTASMKPMSVPTGEDCSEVIDFCSSNPCAHAFCVSEPFVGYTCTCYTGYLGEEQLQPGAAVTAALTAVCRAVNVRPARYADVQAFLVFSGELCDRVDHCASQPCRNNAVCKNLVDTFSCRCPDNYQGKCRYDVI